MTFNMKTKIGEIDYANIKPLFSYLNKKKLKDNRVEFDRAAPSTMNRKLENGEIDVSIISSFSYAENAQRYVALPEVCVSSDGAVNSILLFSKKPIEELTYADIALTATSATSINLLKVIMHHFYQAKPRYQTMLPHLDTMLRTNDAALLIGDEAIKASWTVKEDLHVYDLGELWKKHTGHKMTYAIVAVRKSVLEKRSVISMFHKEMIKSKVRNQKSNFRLVISMMQRRHGGSTMYWKKYFEGLKYDFRSREIQGLELFYHLAYEMNLLKQPVKVELFEPKTLKRKVKVAFSQ